MGMNITAAVRCNNGDILLAHDRDSTDVFAYETFLSGDDRPSREFMEGSGRYGPIDTIREDESGVLVVDFPSRKILFNRVEQNIDRTTFFDPRRPFQQSLALAGRVTLTCPKNSFAPVRITSDMASSWEAWQRTIKPRKFDCTRVYDYSLEKLPAWYFMRLDPRPEFVFDLSPWRLEVFEDTSEAKNTESRLAFWKALEDCGFPVDRAGWMSRFDDDENYP